MLFAAFRFIEPSELGVPQHHYSSGGDDTKRALEQARNTVLLTSMSDLSVQSLQALTIIAFTHVRIDPSHCSFQLCEIPAE